jgi:hypothetical protein
VTLVAGGASHQPDHTFRSPGQIGAPGEALGTSPRTRFRQGNQFHLPQLALGNYTVCLGAAVMASSELDAWKDRASCASGYLSAASALDLRLP